MGLVLQSCHAFQQPNDTESMAQHQHTSNQVPPSPGASWAKPVGLPAAAQLRSIHICQQVMNTCSMEEHSPAPPERGSSGSSVLQPEQKNISGFELHLIKITKESLTLLVLMSNFLKLWENNVVNKTHGVKGFFTLLCWLLGLTMIFAEANAISLTYFKGLLFRPYFHQFLCCKYFCTLLI